MADDDVTALVNGAERHLAEVADDELFMEIAPHLMAVDHAINRATEVKTLRAKRGKDLGRQTRAQFEQMHSELARLTVLLEEAE